MAKARKRKQSAKVRKKTPTAVRDPELGQRILARMAQPHDGRTQALAESLGVPQLAVRAELMRLEREGLVHRTGQTRGTRWHLGPAQGVAARQASAPAPAARRPPPPVSSPRPPEPAGPALAAEPEATYQAPGAGRARPTALWTVRLGVSGVLDDLLLFADDLASAAVAAQSIAAARQSDVLAMRRMGDAFRR